MGLCVGGGWVGFHLFIHFVFCFNQMFSYPSYIFVYHLLLPLVYNEGHVCLSLGFVHVYPTGLKMSMTACFVCHLLY
jgi:hypothetical protein